MKKVPTRKRTVRYSNRRKKKLQDQKNTLIGYVIEGRVGKKMNLTFCISEKVTTEVFNANMLVTPLDSETYIPNPISMIRTDSLSKYHNRVCFLWSTLFCFLLRYDDFCWCWKSHVRFITNLQWIQNLILFLSWIQIEEYLSPLYLELFWISWKYDM